jgi:hypothetical protein
MRNNLSEPLDRYYMAGGPGFEPRLTESGSAPTKAVVGVLRRQGLQPDSPCCFCPIVTNMAEYATASGSAEMVTPKNRLAGGEAPLLCRQHGISQGPARADARRSTGRSPRRGRRRCERGEQEECCQRSSDPAVSLRQHAGIDNHFFRPLRLDRWLEGLQQGNDKLDRFRVPARRVVCELGRGSSELRNLLARPILGDGHGFGHRRHKDGDEVFRAFAAPLGVARDALPELM